MKITAAHLAFYRERKTSLPRWARQLKVPASTNVHTLINANLTTTKGERDIANMVATLKLARQNELHTPGQFVRCLRSYALPTYTTTSKRQAATARKWLSRIKA